MIEIIISLAAIGAVLVVSELLLRKKILHGEIARKFVHIIVGTFIATWAFYMSMRQIQILSVILFFGVIVSELLNIFRSVRGVSRKTWGEPLFAASVGIVITLAPFPWVYAAAIMHMSLADGFAAVVGTKYGASGGYRIFGHYKTILGTTTFWLISLCITLALLASQNTGLGMDAWPILIFLPLLTTLTENVTVRGIDNIAVPFMVLLCLQFAIQVYS